MIAPLHAAVAGAALWLAVGIPLAAADPGAADAFARAEVGIGGSYRTGSWTPVVISFAGGTAAPNARDTPGTPLHVWAEDPDGQFVRSPAGAVAASAQGTNTARFRVRFGRPEAVLLLETGGAEGRPHFTRLRLPPPLPSAETVLLVLGDLPAAERARFASAVRPGQLAQSAPALPEPHASWVDALEKEWTRRYGV